MLSVFILSALLAQSSPSSPMPPLPPDWTPVAVQDKAEYARYIRKEPDGTLSSMTGTRRVCDCDPAAEAATIASTFARTQGVTVARAIVMACGQQAQRVILTGHTDGSNPQANNLEILLFRQEPALVMLMYAFKASAPQPEDEAALLKLCPM
jgi:hypothetical protein